MPLSLSVLQTTYYFTDLINFARPQIGDSVPVTLVVREGKGRERLRSHWSADFIKWFHRGASVHQARKVIGSHLLNALHPGHCTRLWNCKDKTLFVEEYRAIFHSVKWW